MADPRPADPWKLARLVLLLGVMVALLAAGGWARFWWGVPEAPFGLRPRFHDGNGGPVSGMVRAHPRSPNPFEEIRDACYPQGERWLSNLRAVD